MGEPFFIEAVKEAIERISRFILMPTIMFQRLELSIVISLDKR